MDQSFYLCTPNGENKAGRFRRNPENFRTGLKQDIFTRFIASGRSVARLSRLLWEQEVASSNLAAPTFRRLRSPLLQRVF